MNIVSKAASVFPGVTPFLTSISGLPRTVAFLRRRSSYSYEYTQLHTVGLPVGYSTS